MTNNHNKAAEMTVDLTEDTSEEILRSLTPTPPPSQQQHDGDCCRSSHSSGEVATTTDSYVRKRQRSADTLDEKNPQYRKFDNKFPGYKSPAERAALRSSPLRPNIMALVVASRATEAIPGTTFFIDKSFHVIYDAYPKSEFHLLVIPRESTAKPPEKVTDLIVGKHLELLQRMENLSGEIVEHLRLQQETDTAPSFRVGFHALPSMLPLHLHIISRNFEKTHTMKHKKHYNSFATAFFMTLSEVMSCLRINGKVVVDVDHMKLLEKRNLVCFRCGFAASNMPSLWTHMANC